MSDVNHLPNCYQANPELWDAPCICAEIRAEGIKYAYMEWQDKTEWVQRTATAKELGRHRADVMAERIAKAEAERDQLRAQAEALHQVGHALGLAAGSDLTRDVLAGVNALRAELAAIRGQQSATALELRKASSWICREVEAGTASATHWAIRLRERADQIEAGTPQQPDAVSVPIDMLKRVAAILGSQGFSAWDELAAEVLLSTRQAEEGE